MPPDPITLRRGMPEDDEVCGRLVSAATLASVFAPRIPFARPLFEDDTPLAPDGHERIVAEIGGRVIGFLDYDPANRYVKYLFVDPDRQGCGAGSALLTRCEQAVAGPVTLSTLSANDLGLRWFLRRGYHIIGGRLDENWHGGPVVWIFLRKGSGDDPIDRALSLALAGHSLW